MAPLRPSPGAPLAAVRAALLCTILWIFQTSPGPQAAAPSATEHQVKAVFVFNFAHFVTWPAESLRDPQSPFVIGVLGSDPVAAELEEAVRGEDVHEHPLQVRRFRDVSEISDSHILYIDRSQQQRLSEVLEKLRGSDTLTVSDLEGASRRGVMIQFATRQNRIRLLINVESARSAGLTISSNLLRPAEIVRTAETP